MLQERSSDRDTDSFVEYPVYSNFILYSILILVTFTLKCQYSPKVNVKKRIFPEILGAPRKNHCYCFFREALCVQYSNFEMYSVLILIFLIWFPTICPKCYMKVIYCWNSYELRERSSDTASVVEHSVYDNFKMQSFITISCSFTQNECV